MPPRALPCCRQVPDVPPPPRALPCRRRIPASSLPWPTRTLAHSMPQAWEGIAAPRGRWPLPALLPTLHLAAGRAGGPVGAGPGDAVALQQEARVRRRTWAKQLGVGQSVRPGGPAWLPGAWAGVNVWAAQEPMRLVLVASAMSWISQQQHGEGGCKPAPCTSTRSPCMEGGHEQHPGDPFPGLWLPLGPLAPTLTAPELLNPALLGLWAPGQ